MLLSAIKGSLDPAARAPVIIAMLNGMAVRLGV